MKINGAILWEGTSSYDGQPIAVIMTGIAQASTNRKTGDMIQTYILRQDITHETRSGGGATFTHGGG